MATLECRSGSWRARFRYRGEKYSLWIGEVEEFEARAISAKIDYWLMRLKQHLLDLPAGCDIVTFIQHDGKPPSAVSTERPLTLGMLWEQYLESQQKKLEANTVEGIRLHFSHLLRILGTKRPVAGVVRADLQKFVDKRSEEWIDPDKYRKKREATMAAAAKKKDTPVAVKPVKKRPKRHPSPATIKKEVISLRTAWNWARRNLGLKEEFPGGGLAYAKGEEALPFMTWDEAERRIEAGDDPDKVCAYLFSVLLTA